MPRLIWVFAGHKSHFVGFIMLWLNYLICELNLETVSDVWILIALKNWLTFKYRVFYVDGNAKLVIMTFISAKNMFSSNEKSDLKVTCQHHRSKQAYFAEKKNIHLSRLMTKSTKWLCAQRRLRSTWASTQSDQSSLCAQWVGKDPSFLHMDSKDSDQTGRMPRMTWVFAGRTCHFVGFVMRQLIYQCLVFLCLLNLQVT